jgi:hypothetical protein
LDAHAFLMGLRSDPPLFSIHRGYVLRTPLYHDAYSAEGERFHFFESYGKPLPPRFRDETIAHLGAISELVCMYDWPRELVAFEPLGRGEVGPGALDALVESPSSGQFYMGVEAKGDRLKLSTFISAVNRCDGIRSHSDHKKCQALLEFRPPLFWAVALGERQLFRVHQHGAFVRLEPESDTSLLEYALKV